MAMDPEHLKHLINPVKDSFKSQFQNKESFPESSQF